MLTDFR